MKITMVSRAKYQIFIWDFVCWDLFRTPSLSFRFLLQVVTDGLFYKKFIFAIFFTFSTFHQEMHIKYVSFALCPIPVLLIKDDSAQSCLQSVCTLVGRRVPHNLHPLTHQPPPPHHPPWATKPPNPQAQKITAGQLQLPHAYLSNKTFTGIGTVWLCVVCSCWALLERWYLRSTLSALWKDNTLIVPSKNSFWYLKVRCVYVKAWRNCLPLISRYLRHFEHFDRDEVEIWRIFSCDLIVQEHCVLTRRQTKLTGLSL